MAEESVDVCIIGSVWGGAIPALRLSAAGKSVVVLEKGRVWNDDDFQQTINPRYLSSLFRFDTTSDLQVVVVPSDSVLGGTAPLFSNVMLRTPSLVFDRRDAHGNRFWPEPLTRRLLDLYYDRVEAVTGGVPLRWTNPDYPGADCREGMVGSGIWDLAPKRSYVFAKACQAAGYPEAAPVPVALDHHCVDSGWCTTGCRFGAKRTPDKVYIPEAKSQGARFLTEHACLTIEPGLLSERDKVHAVNRATREA